MVEYWKTRTDCAEQARLHQRLHEFCRVHALELFYTGQDLIGLFRDPALKKVEMFQFSLLLIGCFIKFIKEFANMSAFLNYDKLRWDSWARLRDWCFLAFDTGYDNEIFLNMSSSSKTFLVGLLEKFTRKF